MSDSLTELLGVTNDPSLAETGGGHNQKGVEYQRHWAILRMFELDHEGKNFLVLFEAIQDLSILDSDTAPTAICIYQIKKKDRNEWSWSELTKLHTPKDKPNLRTKAKPLEDVQQSPLGKLYAAVRAVKTLRSTGYFVSNAGCDVPLADGDNAATSLPSPLSTITPLHLGLLLQALVTMHADGESAPDLSRIELQRVLLPVDDPGTYLIGVVHKFLEKRSPRHAGQARALVDSLLAKVGPLGAKTDTCKTFNELRKQRGYSREEFVEALGELEVVPDVLASLDIWSMQLSKEGMSFIDVTAIRLAAARIFKLKVMGNSAEHDSVNRACDAWLAVNIDAPLLIPFLEKAYEDLKKDHPAVRRPELLACLAIRAIENART